MAVGIPPYVAYRTFENFLAYLKARGVPSRVDRSVLSHKSGTIQSQLLLCFQYLDLLTASGRPTEKLRGLVASEGNARKKLLQEIIKGAYGFLFEAGFDLQNATTHQLEELFQQTGASGETVRRCISFFLAAAKNAGIPFSAYLKPHRGKKAPPKSGLEPDRPVPARRLNAKEVKLRSGGTLTLELSFNLFDLDGADREFVFELIDHLNEYSARQERN